VLGFTQFMLILSPSHTIALYFAKVLHGLGGKGVATANAHGECVKYNRQNDF
jgi:hypothetical protein